ncbi:MAG: hypothetical protein A3D65_05585 [Candidatus Lloydbacteria bacterium RIFCSPHIGHO2_02_FULL_50_13]|uniref:Homing endonuclease LAGLIDADG domain-containing protein n=1 Tax=Candidatus Lloydbacteria bacterium RIFCSPHIGHO2_02_FULL_50_13 TaxID=1798661 RepID=A0A1G2DAX4_9BACT|nr:MAG: hypothetical protein A3D65_05585 [Candidatus Lloydbacteria bacterium RIFCSPHIGHO2_02_FULL_50_13]
MKLTKEQRAILTGTLLGDAFLQKTGKRNARLRLEHGAAQKEYLFWKAGEFSRLFQGKPVFVERVHPVTKRTYQYWRQQSNATPELGKWRKLFYPDGKKHIPPTLPDLLNQPIALAVWYMDDGYYYPKDHNSYLYLGRVAKEEAEIAAQAISRNFGVHARIYDKKQKGFALYFSPSETQKLHSIIRKHMLPLFQYKLSAVATQMSP